MLVNGLVSIVIPIYNVEKYLRKCVDSVCKQTYKNLQIILVDDGSPDSCPVICDELAVADSRIEVIHKKNGGLSDARNAGLKCAKGEYIYFLDSDDYIESSLVEKCVYEIEKDDLDYVAFSFCKEKADGQKVAECIFREKEYELKTIEEREDFLIQKQTNYGVIGWNAWNRFFRLDLLRQNDLYFPDNKIVFAEDLAFSLRINCYHKRFKSIEDVLYHYIERDDSIMAKSSGTQIIKFINLCDDYQKYLQTNNISFSYSYLFVHILFHEWDLKNYGIDQIAKEIDLLPNGCKKKLKSWFKMSLKRYKKIAFLYGKKQWLARLIIYLKCLVNVK